MAAMRRIDTIEPGRERAFLYGTALRITANYRRGAKRQKEDPAPELDAVESAGVPPDRRAELAQARDLLDELLLRLPAPLRSMLVLVEIEELEVSAAAALEGIPAGTAASRLRRARECFRQELANLGERHPFRSKEERGS